MDKLDFILRLKTWELFMIILMGYILHECKFENWPLLSAMVYSTNDQEGHGEKRYRDCNSTIM